LSRIQFFSSLVLVSFLLPAQDLQSFEKNVTEFTLANGLHFIVVERHEAPVVSFHTYVNVGSVDDPSGATGLAHMFEHMAFKGTETIGTTNWPAEKKALDAIEAAYNKLEAERNKGSRADKAQLEDLESGVQAAIERAQAFVIPNEYTRILEENGAEGLNANTGPDATEYYYSLPSNRLELWFLMESQRFLHPVYREFYKERDVVMEENRMRVESSPEGKLLQLFAATAFAAHPYRNPAIGWPSDISTLRRGEAEAFFAKYYVPSNMVMAIVGDVDPREARRLAEKYFGPMPPRPLPPLVHTEEPPQTGAKQVEVRSSSQPLVVIGYKRPSQYDRDDPVFDVIQLILSAGRTGLIYRDLVQEKKLAVEAEAASAFPGGKYPNLFVFFLVPSLGHTAAENVQASDELLARFQARTPSAEELSRAKTQARAAVIRRLANNASLAELLASAYSNYGNWRKLFTQIDELNHVTAQDVQRVAARYFTASNRTLAYLVSEPDRATEKESQ
jgi:predicted Zn-dependent peptidase